jgi:hypothetical protein
VDGAQSFAKRLRSGRFGHLFHRRQVTVLGDLRTRNVVAVQTAISVEDHRYENDFCRSSLTVLPEASDKTAGSGEMHCAHGNEGVPIVEDARERSNPRGIPLVVHISHRTPNPLSNVLTPRLTISHH